MFYQLGSSAVFGKKFEYLMKVFNELARAIFGGLFDLLESGFYVRV
ncbi:MAG: hypothetical protein UW84_C0040G0011 [Candidatus Collierbacteria bacterium GW2011_GWA2_44_99]|uniref:Uncharacterized protein n=1 Tax=Candidatus Collierbacteria bacterium GW2011_GWA2_44_99 TaxID=1618380 RepID=A0A0G1MWP1_9BACT|nr:MAG: hypothetical protein UW84_C0040G0011 [Candidatus Collierbacteria bacterium GW2011_GWA2_44_99]